MDAKLYGEYFTACAESGERIGYREWLEREVKSAREAAAEAERDVQRYRQAAAVTHDMYVEADGSRRGMGVLLACVRQYARAGAYDQVLNLLDDDASEGVA